MTLKSLRTVCGVDNVPHADGVGAKKDMRAYRKGARITDLVSKEEQCFDVLRAM